MRTIRGTLLLATLLSAIATSPPTTIDGVEGEIFLLNGTEEDQTLTVQELRPSLQLDCDKIARDPSTLEASLSLIHI